jgi:hypothetical protein
MVVGEPNAPTESPQPEPAARPMPSIRITRGSVEAPVVPRRTFASYASQYAYVAHDLRRIAMIAGGLLLVLIVLSFFLG